MDTDKIFYISKDNFFRLLDGLKKDYDVYVPIKKKEERFYKKYAGFSEDIIIGEVRPFEPLKAFFSRAKEVVAEDFKTDIPHSKDKGFAIVGVKSCDLKGFKVQNHVFLNHDYRDPFYIRNREKNLIISADCTCALEVCFCLALGVKPYPEDSFDINLSQIKGGFLAAVSSLKGNEIVSAYSSLFETPEKGRTPEKDKNRAAVIMAVEKNIKVHDIPTQDRFKGIIERNYESDIWNDEAKTCVECGACNTICPTCHCFLLSDQKDKDKMERFRTWDSCMLKDFAKVAGGANPRAKLWMRLRNRFDKKFDFFPKTADVYACTGCGRCVLACPAKIDIRKVLKKLVKSG